MNILAILKHR